MPTSTPTSLLDSDVDIEFEMEEETLSPPTFEPTTNVHQSNDNDKNIIGNIGHCDSRYSELSGIAKIFSTHEYDFYFNNNFIGKNNKDNENDVSFHNILFPTGDSKSQEEDFVIAVRIRNKDKHKSPSFIAEINICGFSYVSDMYWKCTDQFQNNNDWFMNDYDAIEWKDAKIENGRNGVLPSNFINGIDEEAFWISSRETINIDSSNKVQTYRSGTRGFQMNAVQTSKVSISSDIYCRVKFPSLLKKQ